MEDSDDLTKEVKECRGNVLGASNGGFLAIKEAVQTQVLSEMCIGAIAVVSELLEIISKISTEWKSKFIQ